MSANFDLSALALKAVCPGNELLYDDKGLPSVMVAIPKMTYAELGMGESTEVHPAFIVNGSEVDKIYISKYQNIVKNGRAYSLPGVSPGHDISFDDALAACAAKGAGWHLMTRMEWGAILRWCQNNGVMPKGNNSHGKHSSESGYKALPDNHDETYYAYRTLTGTGPLTWYHDQTPSGIADLCGNVSEWSSGIRLVQSEVQVMANNNGADASRSQAANSSEWMAIKADDGTLITPDGSGTTTGSVKMDCVNGKIKYSDTKTGDSGDGSTLYSSAYFSGITCDASIGEATKLLLQDLGLLMYGSENELFSGHLYTFNNHAPERMFYSGGYFNYSSYGLATFLCNITRSYTSGIIGFRAAYVDLPSA